MEGKKLLHSIRLQNLLSYGSEEVEFELEPLNVFIGPNASGKSNFIDAISLLVAAPRNLQAPVREGGGAADDWFWKGSGNVIAQIAVTLQYPGEEDSDLHLSYVIDLFPDVRLLVLEEHLKSHDLSFLERESDKAVLLPGIGSSHSQTELEVDLYQSVLSQFRDPVNHPQLAYTSNQFGGIVIFRGWPFGRDTHLTRPQRADLPDDFLLSDGSNLGLVLNDLQNRRATKNLLLEKLRLLYEGVEDFTTKVQGNTIQIYFHEKGLSKPVPSSRLSDGTLHYLCLLTVLLHPDPPPLICIEEPELGLHPDIIREVGKLLVEASQKTQLIVTTHSEMLVSALSDFPETVVVCERDDRGTKLRRLDRENLREWLDRYSLGDIWAMGEIGGNRW